MNNESNMNKDLDQLELVKEISIIQALSQSYIRLNNVSDKENLRNEIKSELDKTWNREIETEFDRFKGKCKNDFNFYNINSSSFIRRYRIDPNELERDINSIYGNDAFNKLCYVIYCKKGY